MKVSPKNFRTWIEIDARAAKKNYDTFRNLVGKNVKLWSVVKSNAYGHGLYVFSALMEKFGIDGFCVDSVVEGISLREHGIKKPILVLGQTLPARYAEAAKHNITITISNFEALKALGSLPSSNMSRRAPAIPYFHLKIDTGMHRQGFYPEDIPKIITFFRSDARGKSLAPRLTGIYTHFASAKDINYRTFTDAQLKKYETALAQFEKAGLRNLMQHAAATGGTLIDKKYHLDAVRVGIGLYGLWPSKELEIQLGDAITLYPVLSWRTAIAEVKNIKKGDYVGYDMTERVPRDMAMAVLPIGYWHGFARALSSTGEVIVRGQRARVLGRVSMDMVVIAVPKSARAGDIVTLIGKGGRGHGARDEAEIHASESAQRAGTVHYEFLTRLNPLIERIVV